MSRTRISTLIILGVIGAVLAGGLQVLLASSGRPIVNPPITLAVALIGIGAIVITLALPIRRATRKKPQSDSAARAQSSRGPVDPFYATRVVMLAKASALTGALLTGVGAALVVYLLTRSVAPAVGSLVGAVSALVGAVVILVCGLVAESMCRIPPDDDDDSDGGNGRGAPVRVRN